MTPERYNKVKEVFLSACGKPPEERGGFVAQSCAGDEEIRREVESLLKEHERESPLVPEEPEGPLGPMSAILSRAGIDMKSGAVKSPVEPSGIGEHTDATRALGGRREQSAYQDDAHDQTSGTRSGIVDAGRFMAGTVVAERYRIIELLGRGGMGEVYRADDITLNQSIALKFLPALFGSDQKWLERFRNEVRLARQVTHPNVCRVFDIGEYKGEQFISMEYVDGENLASLLRRIGRVPHDKAVLLARQLCAGLASAHDRGVLHQDLKPANVMIDGRGAVRITDFGLAAPADQLKSDLIRAGTPAYMSPEQLAGRPVTVRSDVYSLGLVLYEMFTGRRVFKADNLREYQKLHASEDPTPPSEIVEDIDPIVERVIMRCLEKDPKNRPASAMAVSAALPGGNPLREILAAGETPSPEVVAAAGEAHRAMKPKLAWTLLLTALACMIGFVYMAPRAFVVQRALYNKVQVPGPLTNTAQEKTVIDANPAVLRFKAQKILRDLDYDTPPVDTASGYAMNLDYFLYVEGNQTGKDRLWRLWRPRLGLVYFWYRESPALLVPLRPEGSVVERDPAPGLAGMMSVRLDPRGRLIGLEVEPQTPSLNEDGNRAASPGTQPDAEFWQPLLQAAEMTLGENGFHVAPVRGAPAVYADRRIAWEGRYEDSAGLRNDKPVHVEAAALQGKPVYFAVFGEWTGEQQSPDHAAIQALGRTDLQIQSVVIGVLLAVGGALAWRNYRSGRGDRMGAARMAVAFLILGEVAWLLSAHHVPDIVLEFMQFRRGMGAVLYSVGLTWVFYMALEPSVRRIWPETVISWSRLLSGKWFDPLVGRDVLAGAAVGVMTTLLSLVEYQIPQWLGERVMPVPLPQATSALAMLDATQNRGAIFTSGISALYYGLILLLCLVLVQMACRRGWLTSVISIIVFALATTHYHSGSPWHFGWENALSLAIQCLLALNLLVVTTRHGLVALIFCLLVRAFLLDFPVTWDFSAWYVGASLAGILSTLIVLTAGFYAATGRQPLASLRLEQ